jgi:hypothetical protein
VATDTRFVHGAARLSQRIATLRARLALPEVVPEIGALLLRRTLDRFDHELDPDGQHWKPLTEDTFKRRGYLNKEQARAGLHQMLVRTGTLRDSIALIRGGLDSTFTNTGAGLRIGIPASARDARGELVSAYARIQNRERRFLGIGALDVKAVDGLLRRIGAQAADEFNA